MHVRKYFVTHSCKMDTVYTFITMSILCVCLMTSYPSVHSVVRKVRLLYLTPSAPKCATCCEDAHVSVSAVLVAL